MSLKVHNNVATLPHINSNGYRVQYEKWIYEGHQRHADRISKNLKRMYYIVSKRVTLNRTDLIADIYIYIYGMES